MNQEKKTKNIAEEVLVKEDKNNQEKENKTDFDENKVLREEKPVEESKKIEENVNTKDKEKNNVEEKPELEREYIVNLRREIIKVPRYRRAKKAIRALKFFLAKHMKVENRDIKKVKLDKYLNEEVWYRGIKKPLMKVKIKAKKIKGVVYAELFELPKVLEFKKKREEKFKKAEKPSSNKKIEENVEEKKEENKETKEKEVSTIEAGLKKQKMEAKEMKHRIKEKHKKTAPVRMALER